MTFSSIYLGASRLILVFLSIGSLFFSAVSFGAASFDAGADGTESTDDIEISFSALSSSQLSPSGTTQINENTKIDWDKPIVSRGFGLDDSELDVDQAILADYKSGQVFYFFGEFEKAINKWRPLLVKNFAEAQASMGWLYQAGLGVKKDEVKAFSLYQKAAKQNNAVAQNNLGVMYENGITVDVDLALARHWYALSAEQGYRFAQYNYANNLLLNQSKTTKKNEDLFKRAKLFLKKSADQGVKQAEKKLKSLGVS